MATPETGTDSQNAMARTRHCDHWGRDRRVA